MLVPCQINSTTNIIRSSLEDDKDEENIVENSTRPDDDEIMASGRSSAAKENTVAALDQINSRSN